MNLIDYHMHSSCSFDGYHTMLEMAMESYKKGVRRLCFTDHYDLLPVIDEKMDKENKEQREKMLKMFKELEENKPEDLIVRLGMELGEGNHNLAEAKKLAAEPEMDFVLGSLHNLKDVEDFYYLHYSSLEECEEWNIKYADELVDLSKMDFYDVMAHIGYTLRYMRRDGINANYDSDAIRERTGVCLKNLIEGGRGIEINCSGYTTPGIMGPVPDVNILKMYKDLGGEIITIGTDAHKLEQTASGLREGLYILRSLGYKYITVFNKRKPEFIKI